MLSLTKTINNISLEVECVQSPAAFFAKCLHDAVDGTGTDEGTLTRIIVSRSEIDLGNIKTEYERIYNRTLLSAIKVIRKQTTPLEANFFIVIHFSFHFHFVCKIHFYLEYLISPTNLNRRYVSNKFHVLIK